MKYKMMPVIWVGDLREALIAQYGPDFLNRNDNLRNILFDDQYCNDVAKKLNIYDIEEWDDSYLTYEWFDERQWRIRNCVLTFLQDLFPNQEYVMIDVTW
jgi:hypothetical protein